jgi:hypothetical protein
MEWRIVGKRRHISAFFEERSESEGNLTKIEMEEEDYGEAQETWPFLRS